MVSGLYRPEPTGVGPYSAELAASLVARGHEVEVICATPSYPHWRVFEGYRSWRWTREHHDGVRVVHCPTFVPRKPGGMSRILHYASFAATSLPLLFRRAFGKNRLDLVIHVAPSLLSAPIVLAAARMAGAKSWLHVQDFEVEAGFATGQMQTRGTAARAALAFEGKVLGAYDRVSSISPEMCRKLAEKGCDPARIYELRNWAELDHIFPQENSVYRQRWNISTPHVALYSGSIARKQGIDIVVDVARVLFERPDLTFIVCGNGPTRRELERSAAGLPNIQFHDLQPKEDLGELLALASVHLMPQRADAADLVLPSKLTNMLASGRPVVAGARQDTGLAREVEGVGLICEPDNPGAMAEALTRLLEDRALHAEFSVAAVNRARERWSRDEIVERFAQEIERGVPAQLG
jgi:colanic acid biosynthesis glycosyl transferase WcaI